jgi:hypothetical protein
VGATFQEFLNLAITQGRIAARDTDLGPDTWAALDRVAGAHPEATPQLITDAYNALVREQRPLNRVRETFYSGGSRDFVVGVTKECHRAGLFGAMIFRGVAGVPHRLFAVPGHP